MCAAAAAFDFDHKPSTWKAVESDVKSSLHVSMAGLCGGNKDDGDHLGPGKYWSCSFYLSLESSASNEADCI